MDNDLLLAFVKRVAAGHYWSSYWTTNPKGKDEYRRLVEEAQRVLQEDKK